MKQKTKTLICFETEEKLENTRYPTEPRLQQGGPDSGVPPPYLVATGQAGHAVVGLDIGTKYSRLATFERDEFALLTNAPIPSIAGRLTSGNLTIGLPPSNDTVNVIQNFRGLIGSDWFVEAECGFYSAEMFTELLIKRLTNMGSSAIGRPVSKAVLTTPVTFTSNQRKLLKGAAEAAGVDVLQLLNEPTAAAFYHCYENRELDGNLLVYHLGAGSFAASVMDFRKGLLEVKSSVGDDSLSSQAFIGKLVEWMVATFNAESGYELDKTPATIWRLIRAAEQAIEDLHTSGQAHIKVTNIDIERGPAVGKTTMASKIRNQLGLGSKTHAFLIAQITMKEYMSIIEPVIAKSLEIIERVLQESNTGGDRIQQLLMVGDHRSILPFWNRFYERLPGCTILPCPSSTYPVYGAALQAALLSHSVRDFVVWDVITEPVWVDNKGELKQVIASGTPIPITAYHKCESPDSTVNMHVVQGSALQSEKATLADITVSNCPPTTEGETKVEVHFIASADGIIDYRARHIGLDSMLPISIIDGQPSISSGWSETQRSKTFDEERLNRLARIMNMPPLTVLNVLRSKGYTIEHIKNGRAIEDMLKKLKDSRLEKYA